MKKARDKETAKAKGDAGDTAATMNRKQRGLAAGDVGGTAAMMAQARRDLAVAFSRLESPAEIEQAFVDFLTASEMRDLQARWLIFKMLAAGETQREISRILGVSLCKITRGSRFLKSPRNIVRKMLGDVK
ncbi:MAG: hypothetical protein IJP66_03980 [Kiritimatiellae bacterium]|nr:hypothetical protein [Kiritimatiellia bacterium]